MSTPCIYQIINLRNGRRYIGATVNHVNRWRGHRSQLRDGTHSNRHLLKDFRKYGEHSFEFRVVEYLPPGTRYGKLFKAEQRHFDKYKGAYPLYNIRMDSISGTISEESAKKISNALRNRVFTPEHRQRISEGLRGRHYSAETRRKIGDATRRRGHTQETRQKISEGLRGRKRSAESRARTSKSLKGVNADPRIFIFTNRDGRAFRGTRIAAREVLGLTRNMIACLLAGKRNRNGWTMSLCE